MELVQEIVQLDMAVELVIVVGLITLLLIVEEEVAQVVKAQEVRVQVAKVQVVAEVK